MLYLRLALGKTQDEMAGLLGCSKMTVRRSEYEKRLPTNAAVLRNFETLREMVDSRPH